MKRGDGIAKTLTILSKQKQVIDHHTWEGKKKTQQPKFLVGINNEERMIDKGALVYCWFNI